ncbi:hypothetical protein PMAC_000903 [Pneumocystis sp. 'macacae']|nr:hypothetical protein PMAC_000903 [Pneumocystis sp. 'macacae']
MGRQPQGGHHLRQCRGVLGVRRASRGSLTDRIYNNIARASQLPPKSDYHLFKTGVRPEWEDKQNQRGGRWSYNNRDRRSVNIDELWLHIVSGAGGTVLTVQMLAAIGETLENEGDNEVMGVVVNIRKGFVRLGLWTRSTSNEEVLRAIG